MNKANQLLSKILEILSSSYDYETHPVKRDGRHHSYTFSTDKGNKYHVNIHHEKSSSTGTKGAYVEFEDGNGNMNVNHTEKNSAHRVLGTVSKILKDHSFDHPEIDPYNFAADEHHRPVYKAIMKKIATTHEEKPYSDGKGSVFKVNASDIK